MKNLLYVPCECHGRDHHLVIERSDDPEWDSFLVYVAMPHRSLFKRLKNAFWYVLKGGNMWITHDMVLSKKQAKRLSEFLKKIP